MENMISPYETLKNDKICEILLGNICFLDRLTGIHCQMPELKIDELNTMKIQFNYEPELTWINPITDHRMEYFRELVDHCINMSCCPSLLAYLFDMSRFYHMFVGLDQVKVKKAYSTVKETIIEALNSVLVCFDCEMIVHRKQYYIQGKGKKFIAQTKEIENSDSEISTQKEKILRALKEQRYDDAISDSYTFLEYICYHMIKSKKGNPEKFIGLREKYKEVKRLYPAVSTGNNENEYLKKLMSGLETVVISLYEMRNMYGNVHARSKSGAKIEEAQARLCVNAALTDGEYLLYLAKKI